MIPAKYEMRVFQLLLTGLMTFFVSGAVTLINLGSEFGFWAWMKAWEPTWPIAFLVIIFVAPLAKTAAQWLVKTNN